MKKLLHDRCELKNKFKNRERVFLGWTSLAHPSIAEIFARIPLSVVGIDMEHSVISLAQAQAIILACQGKGMPCLPRVASHNPEMIRRLLDAGADGVIVPMVSIPKEVEAIIEWVKYPPVGKRGYGIARAQNYGFDFDTYVKDWNKNSSLIIQIETIQAVENIDQLLTYDEIDGVMIGPYDIAGSLGVPGQLQHPKVIEAGKIVCEVCRRHHKACGVHLIKPDQQGLNQVFKSGYTFVALASDLIILWQWGEQMQSLLAAHREKAVVS